MARILGVGIAVLDIINTVEHYPREDEEMRAVGHAVRRGGNAANTLSLLRDMGHRASLAAVLAGDMQGRRIAEDLERRGIDLEHCQRVADGAAPTSYITLNRASGSRTIVHYRDLPEYDFGRFMDIDPSAFDWLHFEGRNVLEVHAMIEYARSLAPDTPVSVEIEKERGEIERLFDGPDVLMFSRPFARGRGFEEPEAFLRQAREWAPRARVTLTWGEDGAYALDGDLLVHAPAHPPGQVVDTVGAGDTFNAALIDGLAEGRPLAEALEAGCRLAGRKVGQEGLDGLVVRRPRTEGQVLCRLDEIADPGSRGFEVEIEGRPQPIFVVRKEGRVRGYVNRCPHIGAELNWQPDAFLDDEGRLIQCSVHMALFEIEDGHCVAGPCKGDHLEPLDVRVESDHVVLHP